MDGICGKNEIVVAKVKVVIIYTEGLDFLKAKDKFSLPKKDIDSADRYANEKDKVLHLVSAYLKNKYVGEWTVNEYGKPVSDKVCFNVSHTSGLVAIALADKDVGVDVEKIRTVNQSIIDYVSSQSEKQTIKSDKDFFKVWTAKESLAKAQGKGLVKNVKEIPALHFDGEKEYLGDNYYSRQIEDGDYIITAVRKGKEPFELEIIKEKG